MKKKRLLPEHVSRYRDRHGAWRYRYRRAGVQGGHFQAEFGTEGFRQEYAAFEKSGPTPAEGPVRYAPGTIGALVTRFCSTPSRLGPTVVTQKKVRAVLFGFRDEYGHNPVRLVEFDHLDAIIEAKKIKTGTGNKTKGGIHAARKLRKELVRLFAFGKRIGMRKDNPMEDTQKVKTGKRGKRGGFHSWTEAEITQYRERHALGTRARLALELLLWTGQRRSDVRGMGKHDIVDGRIKVIQEKTDTELWISVAPQLVEAIVAMPPPPADAETFLLTAFGKPFSRAGFGNKMREWCDEAGLPHCTAHGLRKAIMRRMAELEMGNQAMKSVSGHVRDDEVALYTASADQKRMATTAIEALAAWESARELSNPKISDCLTGAEAPEKGPKTL